MDELVKYETAPVDLETGEIVQYNKSFFHSVIRVKELSLITKIVSTIPRRSVILDFGCGSGWLSRILSIAGRRIIGVDTNPRLVRIARKVGARANFVIADCQRLPIRDESVHSVISISAIHHINALLGVREIHRVLLERHTLLAMEPNLFNLVSAIGRKLFPMETHTRGERPFIPHDLCGILKSSSFKIRNTFYLFFFSFPLARGLKIFADDTKLHPLIISLISAFEDILSRIPIFRKMNSIFVVVAEKA
jgi:SAM-dependent methyltransferase